MFKQLLCLVKYGGHDYTMHIGYFTVCSRCEKPAVKPTFEQEA